jgi:hypothetical protein
MSPFGDCVRLLGTVTFEAISVPCGDVTGSTIHFGFHTREELPRQLRKKDVCVVTFECVVLRFVCRVVLC